MEYSAELARLEQFVDKLLEKYNQLKAEHHALRDLLHQREKECAELKNQVYALSSERREVGNKVSGLLDRIEQWEQDQGPQTSAAPAGANQELSETETNPFEGEDLR